MQDVEAIERATLAAVAPRALEELPDWLLPLEAGPVGRAKSAVPLKHAELDLSVLPAIAERYRAHGLPPRFRIADEPGLAALRAALAAGGLAPHTPTLVQRCGVQRLLAHARLHARVDASCDASWRETFVAAGESAEEGEQRLAMLARPQDALFASVREAGAALAVGAATISSGVMCVLGMRTAAAQRGRGLAQRVLSALAERARAQGIEQVVLQVEADNAAALAAYRRAGFETAWCYRYWQAP